MTIECTLDRFLDGRVVAAQPALGFRAGHDSVLLAAAVPAGARVLELGSGAGIATLCYARRVGVAKVTGVEIDPELAGLASANAVRNGMETRVNFLVGDVRDAAQVHAKFDHVFFNPPFHSCEGTRSPDMARRMAKRDTGGGIAKWMEAALGAVGPEGTVTAVLRFDRLHEILAACANHSALVFPLYPRHGAQPRRAIVRVTAGVSGSVCRAAGLILHRDSGGNTEQAEAVLRGRADLSLS